MPIIIHYPYYILYQHLNNFQDHVMLKSCDFSGAVIVIRTNKYAVKKANMSFTELTFFFIIFTGANICVPDLWQDLPIPIALSQTQQDTHMGAALCMPLLPPPICAEGTPKKSHSCSPQCD